MASGAVAVVVIGGPWSVIEDIMIRIVDNQRRVGAGSGILVEGEALNSGAT
jgi:hypothetical protein